MSTTTKIEHPEVTAPRTVKPSDATGKWDEFLGEGTYTDINPMKGKSDPNRIFSEDGSRSIRFGEHEMKSSPTKFHYHQEIWKYDPINDVMEIFNTKYRVPTLRGGK